MDKFRVHDDSLFNINNGMSSFRVNLNDTYTSIESTKRDQDLQLERVEKLENDIVLLKDEYESKIKELNDSLASVKDESVNKKVYED